MAIETTYMRYGHGCSGIIGLTLKPESLKTWSYSLHTCNSIVRDLDKMRDDEKPAQSNHKEEMEGRIVADKKDRDALREKLLLSIDPLDTSQHPKDAVVNIVTGAVLAHPQINVDKAVEVGKSQMQSFVSGWPESFHSTISRKVTTMAITKKDVQVGDTEVIDTEMIYARQWDCKQVLEP